MSKCEYLVVKPDMEFQFECITCGECCRNVKDAVMIESLDLFRLACYLKQDVSKVMLQYTEVKMLDKGFPILVLKTKPHMDVCTFLKSGKCSVHTVKPRTCRIYVKPKIMRSREQIPRNYKDFIAFGFT